MAELKLPPREGVEGAETRLLMAECKGPGSAAYALATAKSCMKLMDLVLHNRLNNQPGRFGASGATDVIGIIKAKGQFAGFEKYPEYLGGIKQNLQNMLNIANDAKDKRQSEFFDFIQAAIEVAKGPTMLDPSPGLLCFWRTAGASGPGGMATKYQTTGGNDFYYLPSPDGATP